MVYASEDAIKSLDVYIKLCGMKDLSQRLSHQEAQQEGLVVDILPPHARANRDRIFSGYGKDVNRMTPGAIGEICSPSGLVTLPPQIHPSRSGRHHIGTVRADTGNTTARVRITDVLAKGLVDVEQNRVGWKYT